ncbi:ThiF family adenylyltransferase [Leptothrix ochracea]|uniref:tRNA threonylcarbamoyladenosine dehydratase n=1 Tax=Leptothrix ochracea TaxID=735331 RepID=UPI0034E1D340
MTTMIENDDERPDLERRFGGLRRLWGAEGYQCVRAARVAVIGVGGVGSWAAEALARCGVAELTLIDLDHVSESNVNRQIQALGSTLGAAKVSVLRDRLLDIHPGCQIRTVEDFVTPENWPALLPAPVDAVLDACDQTKAKRALMVWAMQTRQRLVTVGAAGGKLHADKAQVADLADVTHDPLLSGLRQQLRRDGWPRQGAMGVRCVYAAEPVLPAQGLCESDGTLGCHGYGSSVMVTATFGMVAAGELLEQIRLQM